MRRTITILGSTGSLGTQALRLIKNYPQFEIIALTAHKNAQLLAEQAQTHNAKNLLTSESSSQELNQIIQDADIILNFLSGTAGLEPTKIALKSGKTVLLGNKESLVIAGKELKTLPGELIPVDSELTAIHEIIKLHPNRPIQKIILPCSGGPFLGKTAAQLEEVTPADALNHPTWKMGPKITIESATLLNKGLEVIAAHQFFGIPLDQIEVLIHPECQVHGMVHFQDESLAYLSPPDMTIPIEDALLQAAQLPAAKRNIRPLQPNEINFQQPDHKTFPGIQIVKNAYQEAPSKMQEFLKKEEQIIQEFLNQEISFLEIFTHLC